MYRECNICRQKKRIVHKVVTYPMEGLKATIRYCETCKEKQIERHLQEKVNPSK